MKFLTLSITLSLFLLLGCSSDISNETTDTSSSDTTTQNDDTTTDTTDTTDTTVQTAQYTLSDKLITSGVNLTYESLEYDGRINTSRWSTRYAYCWPIMG